MIHLSGSIENLVDNWDRYALGVSATTYLSYIAAHIAPSLLTKALLVTNCAALGVLLLAETARRITPYLPEKWQRAAKYLRVADIESYGFFTFLFSKLMPERPAPQVKGKTPILFLHGMLGHGKTGQWLLDRLKPHAPVFRIDMGTDLASTVDIGYEAEIERCAAVVRKKISAILEETGQEKIILIGHSRGGVIANYIATSTDYVDQVFTICTPQTRIAPEGDLKAKFMHTLLDKVKEATHIRFIQFTSNVDLITSQEDVLPESAAYSHIEVRQFDKFGHVGGVFSEEVFRGILLNLKDS